MKQGLVSSMRVLRHVSTTSVLLIACAACRLAEPEGCDVCTTSAVVYGVVRDDAGSPVSDARLTISAFNADTSRFRDNVSPTSRNNPTRTNAAGVFRAQPLTPLAPFLARVSVQVAPPSRFVDTVADGNAVVEFRSDYRGPSRDSIRIDIVVRRRTP